MLVRVSGLALTGCEAFNLGVCVYVYDTLSEQWAVGLCLLGSVILVEGLVEFCQRFIALGTCLPNLQHAHRRAVKGEIFHCRLIREPAIWHT